MADEMLPELCPKHDTSFTKRVIAGALGNTGKLNDAVAEQLLASVTVTT